MRISVTPPSCPTEKEGVPTAVPTEIKFQKDALLTHQREGLVPPRRPCKLLLSSRAGFK